MSWQPKYTATDRLIFTMRRIGEEIGEFRGLEIGPEAMALLELEARAVSTHTSTSIEGNPLPLTDVKRLLREDPAHIRDTEREVLNYNRALRKIHGDVESGAFRLDVAAMESIQAIVVDGLMDNSDHVGKLRREPVLIRDPRRPGDVVLIPPDHADVPRLFAELCDYITERRRAADPILLAGLFHRQCVIIHPFMDGNGRTARLLTTGILGQGGLDIFRIFAFENYYNRDISRYFQAVGLRGDYYETKKTANFTAWLEYFGDGILDELRRVRGSLPANAPARLEEHHQRILAHIGEHGSISQREYGQISNRSLAVRKLDFRKLSALGLIERRGGGRSTYYVLAAR
jgi:Fic family protein